MNFFDPFQSISIRSILINIFQYLVTLTFLTRSKGFLDSTDFKSICDALIDPCINNNNNNENANTNNNNNNKKNDQYIINVF